jgi:hypothetical protein
MEGKMAWLMQASCLCIKASDFEDFLECGDKHHAFLALSPKRVRQSASGFGHFIPRRENLCPNW